LRYRIEQILITLSHRVLPSDRFETPRCGRARHPNEEEGMLMRTAALQTLPVIWITRSTLKVCTLSITPELEIKRNHGTKPSMDTLQ
jgi:hypothetical protein